MQKSMLQNCVKSAATFQIFNHLHANSTHKVFSISRIPLHINVLHDFQYDS